MNNRTITLTNTAGHLAIPTTDAYEPLPGSVALSEGLHGTAWQRHFSDGLWYATRGGEGITWYEMLKKRNLVLVYDAEERGH